MLLNIFNYPESNLKLTDKALEGGRDGVLEIKMKEKNINKK